jgi:hypothetical protein
MRPRHDKRGAPIATDTGDFLAIRAIVDLHDAFAPAWARMSETEQRKAWLALRRAGLADVCQRVAGDLSWLADELRRDVGFFDCVKDRVDTGEARPLRFKLGSQARTVAAHLIQDRGGSIRTLAKALTAFHARAKAEAEAMDAACEALRLGPCGESEGDGATSVEAAATSHGA